MSEFKKQRGESAAAWCARLSEIEMAGLSPRQVEELTLRRVIAGRALRREARGREQPSVGANGGPDSHELRRCKEAVQALSDEDRRRLIKWLDTPSLE